MPIDAVLDTNSFDLEKAQLNPLWARELYGFKDHVPETEEYGISSFVYKARAPFHPERFNAFINSSWSGVLRAKGFFWLATRPTHVGELSQAGALVKTGPRGYWWAAVPKREWPQNPQSVKAVMSRWHEAYGDRRQQLVFIGIDMDEADLRRRLDACLIGAEDVKAVDHEALRLLPDSFPRWEHSHAA